MNQTLEMTTYDFSVDEKGALIPKTPGEIPLSQGEYGGVRFVFTLPPSWHGCQTVSLEYYNKKTPAKRIRTNPLPPDTDGRILFEISPGFTRTVGSMVIQLVGDKPAEGADDGKVLKTLTRNCPNINIVPAVNALAAEAADENNVISDMLTRLSALETVAHGNQVSAIAELRAELAAKADKTELAAKADVSALATKADAATVYTKTETAGLVAANTAGVKRTDTIWEGIAFLPNKENAIAQFSLSNFDYNKYSEFELHFENIIFKFRKTNNTTCIHAPCKHETGSFPYLYECTVYVELSSKSFTLSDCLYFYYNNGIEMGTDSTTVYKIVGIY